MQNISHPCARSAGLIVSSNLNLILKNLLYHSMVNDCAFEVILKMFGCFGVLLYSRGGTNEFLRPLMCLHRGCVKRRSQKCRKCEGQDKVEKRGNLLPELVAVAVSFRYRIF